MAKSAQKSTRVTRRKRSVRSYKTYINRILRSQNKTRMTLSSRSMAICQSFVTDMFDQIATQAGSLARINKRATLGSKEVQTAVRLVLPAELAKHACAEGTKAVAKAAA